MEHTKDTLLVSEGSPETEPLLRSVLDPIPFDLLLSVGPACRPAQQIKAAGLRFTAAPMDWMQLYSLDTFLHLFQTDFSDFFVDIAESDAPHGKNRRVVDLRNNITSIHHFPASQSLTEGQSAMRKTMLRRSKNIQKILKNARNIGLLCNRPDTPEELESFRAAFQKLYPQARCVLINIRDTDTNTTTVTVSADGDFLEVRFRDVHPAGGEITENPDAWHGNSPQWQSVLSHVHLRERRRSGNRLFALFQRRKSS